MGFVPRKFGIGPGSTTRTGVCAIIDDGVTVGSNFIIGDYSSVEGLSIIGDNVIVGGGVHIGAFSEIGDGVTIADYVTIADGSCIPEDFSITQDTLYLNGSIYGCTMHEYGLTIGCITKTPEEWSSADLDIIDLDASMAGFRENLDALVGLWYTFFEWRE